MSAAPIADIAASRPAQRTQPHNVDAERSVLGAVFISAAVFDEIATVLHVDDFFMPAHREIFEAMAAVRSRRHPLDFVSVADELKARGMISRLDGGESYLLGLANTTPLAENADHYARIVRERATLRRLIAACAEVQSSAYGDFGEFDAFLSDAEAKVKNAVAHGAAGVPPLTELVDRLAPTGERFATELRTLDGAHRGGFQAGRFVIVAGAPSAGKTSLAIDLAVLWARSGVRVSVLAADEPAQGLLVRVGQILGLARDELEAGDPVALEALRRELGALPCLTIVDADQDGATVETAARALQRVPGRAVLVVDSLQTARAAGSVDADNPRARVDAVLAACKAVARRGTLVVATCELARGAYRSKDAADRTEDLASGKESGSIEYSAATLLVLRPVAEEVGQIDVAIAKNRGGAKTPFRLVMDFTRARLRETAIPTGVGSDGQLDALTQLETDMTAAREVLRANPGLPGFDRLRAMMGGMSMSRRRSAVAALRAAGEIVDVGTRQQPRLYLKGTEPNG